MNPSIAAIQQLVSQRYRVTVHELLCHRREQRICLPRHIAMFLARELTPASLPMIGNRFGGRDHTTVISACRRVEAMLEDKPAFAGEVAALMEQLQPEAVA